MSNEFNIKHGFISSGDSRVNGTLTTTALNIQTVGGGTPLINLGLDSSGNIVTGTTSTYWTSGSSGNYSIKANNDSGLDATAAYSYAEGNGTKALATYTHAEGFFTTASGSRSHSEGNLTTALGAQSHAGGSSSIASGSTSFVHGSSSIAGGNGTVVLGNNLTGTTDNTVYVNSIIPSNGATGTFTTVDLKTVTVTNGIITSII